MKNVDVIPPYFTTRCKRAFYIIALLAAIFVIDKASASTFKPPVTNYTSRQFGANNQNWSCAQDSDGVMYFGNNDGLLTFDGSRWQLYTVPGKYIVRTVFVDGDRVYVGAYEEFGYFKRDQYGDLRYTSLSEILKSYKFKDDEVWKIVSNGEYIIFQTFRSWFVYDGERVKIFQFDDVRPLYIFNVDGKFYAQLIGKGVCELDPVTGRMNEIISRAEVGDDDVVSVLPYEALTYLLATESNGLFLYDVRTGRANRFVTDYDHEIKHSQVNRMIMTVDRDLMIGTIKGGLFALNMSGKAKWHYSLLNGLGNNSVLGLFQDHLGNIWTALDNGISLIHTSVPFLILAPERDDPYIGMAYALTRQGDKLYIGTNQGVYCYDFVKESIEEVDNMHSQVWYVKKIDDQLFVGGNRGVRVEGPYGTDIYDSNGTDIIRAYVGGKEILVESSYFSVNIYGRDGQLQWRRSHKLENFGTPIRQIENDYDGSLWCAHSSSGAYRLELSDDLTRVKDMQKFISVGPRKINTEFVMKIRGRVAVSNGDSLYVYSQERRCLVPFDSFNKDLPMIRDVVSSTKVDDNLLWVASKGEYNLIGYYDGHYRRVIAIPLELFMLQSNGLNNTVFVDDDKTSFFTLNNAIGRLRLTREPFRAPLPHVTIGEVMCISEDGVEERLPINSEESGVSVPGNISFKLRFPNYNATTAHFRYELDGGRKKLEQTSPDTQIEYAGLAPGDYTFRATLVNNDDEDVETTVYHFKVTRPWYLRWWAFCIYLIGLVVIAFVISRWRLRRILISNERRYEIEQAAQSIKILEQERIIAEQQKRLLESELTSKSKQLAALAIDMATRQTVIENLNDTIRDQKRKGNIDSEQVNDLLRQIKSDIDDKEFWNIYQKNFDLIHENFFRNLSAIYPSLTPTDLRFCALLRLNMSTKDIAKFTNLTVRGVETARYRLRRKLQIADKESLVQFLIDFKGKNVSNNNNDININKTTEDNKPTDNTDET